MAHIHTSKKGWHIVRGHKKYVISNFKFFLNLQNFVAIGWMVAELLQVFNFQHGGRPPSWIFKICNFLPSARFGVTIGVIMQNFVVIGWTVAEILHVFDFQYGGRPPSWIFKICKFSASARFAVTICNRPPYWKSKTCNNCATIQTRVIMLNGCGVILQVFDFNMAAVRHIGLFVRIRGTTSKVTLLVFITVQNMV